MKPPPFDYLPASAVEEVISLLSEHGEDAKILAGGQSLMPLLNFRLAQPRVLVDINRVAELSYLHESEGSLRIGALTRHRALETSALVKSRCPILSYTARFVGHLAIRNRGTFGGSLAHFDPAAEFPLVLTALEGQIVVRGKQGERRLTAEGFFVDLLTTALLPGEVLIEARVPCLAAGTGWGFHELTLEHGAFALVAAAALVSLEPAGTCRAVRIALGNAGPVPIRARDAEEMLQGARPTSKLLREAAQLAQGAAAPIGDVHASAEYKKAMVEVLVRRALEDALARASHLN